MHHLTNSNLPTSIAVVLGFLFLLILPFDNAFAPFHLDEFKTHCLGDALKNLVIIVFGWVLIRRYGYAKVGGLSRWWPKHPLLVVVPLYFVLFGPLQYLFLDYQFRNIEVGNVLLLFCSMLTVGLSEEIIFRGFVLPNLIKGSPSDQSLMVPVVTASLLFGVLHFLNLLQADAHFPLVLAQVIYATMFGVAFGIVLLRTGAILPLGLLHGIINFSSNWDDLPGAVEPADLEVYRMPEAIISVLVVLPFLLYVLREFRKIDREALNSLIFK